MDSWDSLCSSVFILNSRRFVFFAFSFHFDLLLMLVGTNSSSSTCTVGSSTVAGINAVRTSCYSPTATTVTDGSHLMVVVCPTSVFYNPNNIKNKEG